MKKFVLFIVLAVFVSVAYGQKINEDFEGEEIPSSWTIHDYGYNPATWSISDFSPHSGSYHIELDCYETDSTNSGKADDWIITPEVTVNTGDVISVWAKSSSADYPDGFEIRASTGSTDTVDFTVQIADYPEVPTSYTKYTINLTDIDGISDGDAIYIGIHGYTNGSYLNMDDIYVGEPPKPKMQHVYSVSETALNVEFDIPVAENDIHVDSFNLVGTEAISFDTAVIDPANDKLVHLRQASAAMTGDITVDKLINNLYNDTTEFYAGIMPMEFTNVTNPDGLMEEGYDATFTGIVVDKGSSNTVWISEATGARNTVMAYSAPFASDVAIGDSVMIYGEYSPYSSQSELYEPTLVKMISEGNALPEPVTITAADINWNNPANEDPAEQYENVPVRLENVVVYDTLTNQYGDFYFFAHSESASDTFRIGDRYNIFDEGFSGELFNLGETYNINGIVVGQYGEWHLAPHNMHDIEGISDSDKPTVTAAAQTVTNGLGQFVDVSMDEAGTIYVVEENAAQASVADLDAAAEAYEAAKTTANANEEDSICVAGLKPGTYYAYAVDLAGNMSDKGANAITIESSAIQPPYKEDFEASDVIPDNIMLKNLDEGTPATSLPEYQNLADSAFIVVNSALIDVPEIGEDNNIAVGTSWYNEEVDANDWMIMPKLMLGENSQLSWQAMSLTSSGNYPDDYTVYVSTTTPEISEFEPIYEVTAENVSTAADNPGEGMAAHSVMLADSGYANQEVYIAFQLNTPYPGGDRLGLDNIVVAAPDNSAPTVSVEEQTASVGDDIMVQSSEGTGKVYLILEGEPQSTIAELDTAVASNVGACAEVTAADTDIPVSTANLLAGTYYAYAVDSAKNMSAKSTNAVTLEAASAIEDVVAHNSFKVYPNPVSSSANITLKLQKTTDVSLKLYDMHGRMVKSAVKSSLSQGKHNLTLDMNSLRGGSYFLKMRIEDETIVKHLIVR